MNYCTILNKFFLTNYCLYQIYEEQFINILKLFFGLIVILLFILSKNYYKISDKDYIIISFILSIFSNFICNNNFFTIIFGLSTILLIGFKFIIKLYKNFNEEDYSKWIIIIILSLYFSKSYFTFNLMLFLINNINIIIICSAFLIITTVFNTFDSVIVNKNNND